MSHQIHFGDINIYSLSTRKFAKFHEHLSQLGVEVVSLQETFHHQRSAVLSNIGQHYSYVEKERPSATRSYKRGGVMIMAKKGVGVTLTKMDARYKPTSFEYIVGVVTRGPTVWAMVNVY